MAGKKQQQLESPAPVKLGDLRPGALVAQEPKRICRTEWTEDAVTVWFEDGTSLSGGFSDAVQVVG